MFDYVRNEFNPSPSLVTEPAPAPAGRVARHLPFSAAPVVDLPGTVEDFHATHGGKYWSTLRRKERRFATDFGAPVYRYLTAPEEIATRLPQVQQLFAQRWRDEYTGLDWKTAEGFRPYAEAMLGLAEQGRAVLVTLEGDGTMLAFAYCLCEPPWFYVYQHATTQDPAYRAYSPGKQLMTRLIADVIETGDYRYFDLMLGERSYKAEWANRSRQVYLRLEDADTVVGRARLAARTALARVALHVRFGSPRMRRAAKWVLLQRQRRQTPRPPSSGVSAPAPDVTPRPGSYVPPARSGAR